MWETHVRDFTHPPITIETIFMGTCYVPGVTLSIFRITHLTFTITL